MPGQRAELRLGAVCAASLRYWAVQIRPPRAASAAGIGAQYRILGQDAHPQTGPFGADPDAGGLDAHRRPAVASDIKPGLATEWHVDEANDKRWIFTLRQGVKWHDGCPFTADDVRRLEGAP